MLISYVVGLVSKNSYFSCWCCLDVESIFSISNCCLITEIYDILWRYAGQLCLNSPICVRVSIFIGRPHENLSPLSARKLSYKNGYISNHDFFTVKIIEVWKSLQLVTQKLILFSSISEPVILLSSLQFNLGTAWLTACSILNLSFSVRKKLCWTIHTKANSCRMNLIINDEFNCTIYTSHVKKLIKINNIKLIVWTKFVYPTSFHTCLINGSVVTSLLKKNLDH